MLKNYFSKRDKYNMPEWIITAISIFSCSFNIFYGPSRYLDNPGFVLSFLTDGGFAVILFLTLLLLCRKYFASKLKRSLE